MTWIEGIGDEVVQFGVIVVFIVILTLAWISTSAMPDYYRTMLVMRSRGPVTVSIRTTSEMPTVSEENVSNNPRAIPLQEMDSIVDADMAMMDNNRLHFYRRIGDRNRNISAMSAHREESAGEESETQEDSDRTSNDQMREMDSIVNAMEADVTAAQVFTNSTDTNTLKRVDTPSKLSSCDCTATANTNVNSEETSQITENEANQRKILIKLKFLNDSSREVEGSLDELLKDFKWRHFPSEMNAGRRVRLIFNGHALSEEATLHALGLYNNAVVHCLIYPTRGAPQQRTPTEELSGGARPAQDASRGEAAQQERTWDLENILMTLISVALTVVWFFRCEYSNMFTASASVALIGLTVFYSVAIFGLYLSDNFNFDRRPRPLNPN